MMTCRQIQNELSAYLDGELADAGRAAVQTHLDGCEACRQRLAQLQRLNDGVARLPRLEPPTDFVPEMFRKLRSEARQPVSWVDVVFRPLWLKVPMEAVALIALAVGVIFAVRQPPAKETPTSSLFYTAKIEPTATPQLPAGEVSLAKEGIEQVKRLKEEAAPRDSMKSADNPKAPDQSFAAAAPTPRPPRAPARPTAPAGSAAPAAAPTPVMPEALSYRAEKLDSSRRLDERKAVVAESAPTGGALALDAAKPVATAANGVALAGKVTVEKGLVVANIEPSVAEQRVRSLLKAMKGNVVEVKRDGGVVRNMRVRVPSALLSEFKSQLAENRAAATGMERKFAMQMEDRAGEGDSKAKEATRAREVAKDAPMVELEIRFVSPSK